MVAPHLFMRKFQILRCCGQFRLICLLVNTLIENEQTQTTELNIAQIYIGFNVEMYGFTDCPVSFTFAHMMEFEYQSKILMIVLMPQT